MVAKASNGFLPFDALLGGLELGVERERLPTEWMAECIADAIEATSEAAGTRPWERQAVRRSPGVVGVGEVVANLRVHKSGAVECHVGAVSVRADIQRLARRIMQVGGELSFPVGHTDKKSGGSHRFLPLKIPSEWKRGEPRTSCDVRRNAIASILFALGKQEGFYWM